MLVQYDRAPDLALQRTSSLEMENSPLERLLAVALEHQVGGAPDVDLGYHAAKAARPRSIKL